MDIIPDKRRLIGLVEQASSGKLCLPNFQRDFVWRRDAVSDLVRSVLRRYYIGSLLLLRCDPHKPPFAPAFVRGANPLYQNPQPELLILDGQQRLTSLLYALAAPDLPLKDSVQRRWFFIDLDLLIKDPSDDEIVFDRSKKELDGLDQPEVQYKRHILPCTMLLNQSDFLTWRDGLDDWLREQEPDNHKLFRLKWRDPWTKAINNFQSFEVPLVELPRVEESDSEAIGRVCAIFEKLNSTGVALSVYDLLTARLYRDNIRLHDLWNESCKVHKRLAQWTKGKADTSGFGIMVLRTLALMRGLEVKPSVLIDLEPKDFARDWDKAAAAVERALELLTNVTPDGFGVFDVKWLPGFGLIPVLAALRAEIENRGLGEQARADLRRWYWCNVFLERYSSAVESKSRKDYTDLLNYWREGKDEPEVFRLARQRIGAQGFTVRDSASYASAVYSGIFCLLALRNARDWALGEAIQLQNLQDHHIFPKAYLRAHGITEQSIVNSVVNRTLISDKTNNRIKDQPPADYIQDSNVFPDGISDPLVKPHFMGNGTLEAMRMATETLTAPDMGYVYEEFRKAREADMVNEIRRVCGISG